jgi:hypothetical protein
MVSYLNRVQCYKAEGIEAVALNMLKLGIKIEDISQATGLSKQEIQSL